MKKRYAIVGLGYRGTYMFLEPMHKKYQEVAQLVALCDSNRGRAALARERTGLDLPIYTDYQQMLAEVDCDTVIVSTPDFTHHKVILASLRSGKDVICEKPMTIFDDKCREILAAEKETGKKVTVTFNCRFHPYMTKIKELVAKVGKTYSVELDWYLDTVHGADYFRRWHSEIEKSGGLLLHKSTHHFDLVNWFIAKEPTKVYATGKLNYYGKERRKHGVRCLDCGEKEKCPFYLDLKLDHELKEIYLDHENLDGYLRDRCIYDQKINIYDTMSAIVEYDRGAVLTYTLDACAPFEGWHLAINGSLGRLECRMPSKFYPKEIYDLGAREKSGRRIDPLLAAMGDLKPQTEGQISFYPIFGGVKTFRVPYFTGSHGGSDELLRHNLFHGVREDPLGQMADSWAGAMSLLIGVAANKSIETGKPISIATLLKKD